MDTAAASITLSWMRLPLSSSLMTEMCCGTMAGSLAPMDWSSPCGIIARTRPIGVESDWIRVISPLNEVVKVTVPGNLSEALKKMLAREFSANSLRA